VIPAPMALPMARLTRTRRGGLLVVVWGAIAVAAALAERSRGIAHPADRALLDTFGGVALPLLAYAVVGAALGGDGLRRAGRALVSFGAEPWRVALGGIAVAAGATALVAAVIAGIVAALAHGPLDPPLARDVLTSAWVASLGGVAYASLFALGASFGKRGGGRTAVLALDWLLGSGTGVVALGTPRAHVRSLLGGEAPAGLAAWTSSCLLIVLALAFAGLAIRRARR
jgi:hypothetical protein